jgi:hypothetical protein
MKRLIACSAVVSAVIFTIAAAVYPGGSHFDHDAVGHDFWRNSLCDVARQTALNDAPNALGAALAQAAMSILAIGIGLFLWSLAEELPSPRSTIVRIFTAMTVPAALAVVFLPTDRFSDIHGIAVVIAGIFGTTAATVTLTGRVRLLGIATLVTSFIALGVYMSELSEGGPPRAAVPVFEHFAALLLLAWMISHAFESSHVSSPRRPARADSIVANRGDGNASSEYQSQLSTLSGSRTTGSPETHSAANERST